LGIDIETSKKAMDRKDNRTRVQNDQTSNIKAFLPYIRGVTDKIAKVLKKKEITTSFKPLVTIRQRMKSVKDPIDQQQGKGIYKVSCSCGKCYIGETRRSFQVRIKEHGADIRNERIHTSALAEHSLKTKHHVLPGGYKDTSKRGSLLHETLKRSSRNNQTPQQYEQRRWPGGEQFLAPINQPT
jgi:hypothetical protein